MLQVHYDRPPRTQTLIYFTFVFVFGVSLLFPKPKTTYAQGADTTPPVTTATLTPASPDGENDWYVSPVQIKLDATDLESGVKEIWYSVDGGTWQTTTFSNTQNLISNPSFETAGATSTGIQNWELTVNDPEVTALHDNSDYAPGYATNSSKLTTTGGSWHGINNKAAPIPVTPYDNMEASVWMKINQVSGNSYYKVYAILDDLSEEEIVQSSTITGTQDWTKLNTTFSITNPNTTHIYIDIGHVGPGNLNIDAASITSSVTNPSVTVLVGSDNPAHTVEYYAVDNAGNTEVHSCIDPKSNCVEFKLDQTPPSNWRNSGAIRSLQGSAHELWVYSQVDDPTSGLSPGTDQYMYHTEREPGFGRYVNLLGCSTAWQDNVWTDLITDPFGPGEATAQLITPKTDFCNNNWKECKTVRFTVEDMAGNSSQKDLCINGPWIQVIGSAAVRANNNISMVAEAETNNTDGLIESAGSDISFFTSSRGWSAIGTSPVNTLPFSQLYSMTGTKTNVTSIPTSSGVFETTTNFTVDNQAIPIGYQNQNNTHMLIYINGDLTIENDLDTHPTSTLLFVVSGNVNIDKKTNAIGAAIVADGDINTAYNVSEGEAASTLELNGIYVADEFVSRRTLQGTQNEDTPSEIITYEPKYLIEMKQFFDNNTTSWTYE